MNRANIMQAMNPDPQLIRLKSLTQRTHDASALASFIERSKPSLSINIFDLLSWICHQIASDHVQMNLSCLFAQSLLRCIEAVNTHAGNALLEGSRQGFLEILPNVITDPNKIWTCVQDIHEHVVNDVDLETSARLLTARTNLTVINILVTLPTINITSGITAILMQMAHLEMIAGSAEITEEHDVIMKLKQYLPMALRSPGPEIVWQKEVLEPMLGSVACIASVALWHLEVRQSLPDTSPDWAMRVGYAARLIHILSTHSPIGDALVVQNSHIILAKVLTRLSAKPHPASAELSLLVDSACAALVVQLYKVDSLERQIAAHEAGILPAVLRCSKLLKGDIYVPENGWYILLFKCLLPFIIYPSIFRVVKREMHHFKIKCLAPEVERLYTQLRAMTNDIATIKLAKPDCENCRKRDESKASKLCAGCKRIFYCSKACQTSHWKMHRDQCKSQQTSDTSNASLSPEDYFALPDMLQRELHMRFNQIIYIRRRFAFKEPLNVEINFAVFPFQITVGSVHFVPEGYHQLAPQDRGMIDKLEETASEIPRPIVARFLYPAGNMQHRLGGMMILNPPKVMRDNMQGKLSEKYFCVRVRKDNGTYEDQPMA